VLMKWLKIDGCKNPVYVNLHNVCWAEDQTQNNDEGKVLTALVFGNSKATLWVTDSIENIFNEAILDQSIEEELRKNA
jgi:hypothetical protein